MIKRYPFRDCQEKSEHIQRVEPLYRGYEVININFHQVNAYHIYIYMDELVDDINLIQLYIFI